MNDNENTDRSIVLVPGHWLGGWAWDAVAAGLTRSGHHVEAVTLPGASPGEVTATLSDQIDALAQVVSRQPEPPVVVAHSGASSICATTKT